MQDQPSNDSQWLPDSDEVARIVLGTVVDHHPGLVAVDELVRQLCHPTLLQPMPESFLRDGLADLTRSGLIHRLDSFVFASRTAVRASELAS